jgi:hypothetical protein
METMECPPVLRKQVDLNRMCDDIIRAAEIADAPHDKDAIWPVLNAYGDFYSMSPVSFVTNTKPKEKRRLHFRYVELQVPHDAYAIAFAQGFITKHGHAIDEMIPALQSACPIQGYGVDTDAASGLAKLWVFLRDFPSIDSVCAMPFLPESVRGHAEYFAKYGLGTVSLFAVDYRHRTINIYFMVSSPGQYTADKVARMIGDLQLEMPSAEILEYCSRAVTIYPSFAWESPRIERICFGIPAPRPSMVPTHLHPLISRYTAEAPTLGKERQFIFGISRARDGSYVKIENDYSGSMVGAMNEGAQAVVQARQRM